MDDSGEAATPYLLLSMIHTQFPQFAERDNKGTFFIFCIQNFHIYKNKVVSSNKMPTKLGSIYVDIFI